MHERKHSIFTIPEAAARLSVDRSYLYRLVRQGGVRALKDDKGRLAIPESELIRLAEERAYIVNLSPARDPIDESALSEKARTLYTVLSTASGLAPSMLRNLITKYEKLPDLYDNTPWFLYADLVNAGLPWYRAMSILTQFYHLTNPGALQGLFPFPSNFNPLIPFMPGAKAEDEEEKEERRAQKRMERMMKFLFMVAAIKSLGGAPSQPSFMQFPPIPGAVYRPVLDKDGKPLRDEMGNIIYAMTFMQPADMEQ